jgi:hypothetical protein
MITPYLTELVPPLPSYNGHADCNGLWTLNGTLPSEYASRYYENKAAALTACLEAITIIEAYSKVRGV